MPATIPPFPPDPKLPKDSVLSYRTRSLYESAFLLSEGFRLLGTYTEQGRAVIVFEETPALREAVRAFYGPDSKARRLFQEFVSLKDLALGNRDR